MCDAQELHLANEEDQYLWCELAICAGNEDLIRDVLVVIDSLEFKTLRKESVKGVEIRESLRQGYYCSRKLRSGPSALGTCSFYGIWLVFFCCWLVLGRGWCEDISGGRSVGWIYSCVLRMSQLIVGFWLLILYPIFRHFELHSLTGNFHK